MTREPGEVPVEGRTLAGSRQTVRQLVRVAYRAGDKLAADSCHHLAASMSFRILFSLVPLLILVVSVFGLVLQDDRLRMDLVAEISDLIPITAAGQDDLERILSEVATPVSAVGLLSLLALFWGASGMMGALRAGLNAAWNVDQGRSILHGKLFDFVLVVVAGLAILASFALSIAVHVLEQTTNELAGAFSWLGPLDDAVAWTLGIIVPFLLIFAAFLLIYRFVPGQPPGNRALVLGAFMAAVGFDVLKNGYAIYLSYFTNFNALYGALGALFGFLLFVYLSAIVTLYCAEYAAEAQRANLGGLFEGERHAQTTPG